MVRARFISNSYQLTRPDFKNIKWPRGAVYARVDMQYPKKKSNHTDYGNYTRTEFKREIQSLFQEGAVALTIRFIDGEQYEQELADLQK